MLTALLVSALFFGGAEAWCKAGYSCCCHWSDSPFIIVNSPVDCECVENEGSWPRSKDNCARDGGRSKPSKALYLVDKDWALHGICPADSPVVTRDEMNARDEHQKALRAGYDKYCAQGEAGCDTTKEFCSFSGFSPHEINPIFPKGPFCWCRGPYGKDQAGKCTTCDHGYEKGYHDEAVRNKYDESICAPASLSTALI